MSNIIPRKIYSCDKVCYNCDNFIREERDFKGLCILKEKSRDNESLGCKKFIEKVN